MLAMASPAIELPDLGDPSSGVLSPVMERKLGEQIMTDIRNDPGYLRDVEMVQYLNELADRLLAGSPDKSTPITVFAVRDRSINAFALPGGFVGVHTGLMRSAHNESELAGVMGHEISHVTQRHIARMMSQDKRQTPLVVGAIILGALAASRSPDAAAALITGGQAAAIQGQLNFSRDMEREADRIGYGVFRDAGFATPGMATMFEKLDQASRLNDSGGFPYLRSHPLTTERIADMQSRLPLGVAITGGLQDMEQAMVSARARVLSQSQVDSLRAWTQLPVNLPAQATSAQKAGALYAATLAHQLLREPEAARQQWQNLQSLTTRNTAAARLSRLLGAELQAARGEYPQVVQALQPSSMTPRWPRPELVATAQSLAHLPTHPATNTVVQQLRQQVQGNPHDAQAWNLLATLLAGQGQKLGSLRAEGEAQLARMDLQGALDRFRAAQDVARLGRLQAGDHIEASIVDTRVRQIQEQLREMQKER